MSNVGAWILGAAGLIIALGVIWKQFIFPAARVISRAEETLPVLQQIAREFSKNGGSTLKDQIDRIEAALTSNGHDVKRAQTTADEAKSLVIDHLQQGRRRAKET